MERPNLARRALMEAIGTFALVTAGCGAIITNTTHPGAIGDLGVSLVFGLTAFLMFVITAVATDTRAVGAAAAIAIGGTVGLDALFGGPITGASMNPARSFGPALASGTWSSFWVYVLGPLIGATIGVFAYELVRGSRTLAGTATQSTEGTAVDGERPVRLPA